MGRALSAWRPDHRLTCRCDMQRAPGVVLHINGMKTTPLRVQRLESSDGTATWWGSLVNLTIPPDRNPHVPLDRIPGRDNLVRTLRYRARAFAGRAEHPLASVHGGLERRRLWSWLVWRASGARPLSRDAPGMVGRKSALSLPPSALPSLFCACACRDRHGGDAAELSSLR